MLIHGSIAGHPHLRGCQRIFFDWCHSRRRALTANPCTCMLAEAQGNAAGAALGPHGDLSARLAACGPWMRWVPAHLPRSGAGMSPADLAAQLCGGCAAKPEAATRRVPAVSRSRRQEALGHLRVVDEFKLPLRLRPRPPPSSGNSPPVWVCPPGWWQWRVSPRWGYSAPAARR